MDAHAMSKVTSFSIDDILTRRREEMKEEQTSDTMKGSSSDLSRPGSPAQETASPGSSTGSPAPASPVGEERLSPKLSPQGDSVGLRDVGGLDPKQPLFHHHHSHHTALTAPPYFPYYPANTMIQRPPGGPPLFVQTSFGMVPAAHQRAMGLQRQHPSSAAGVTAGTPHSHIPNHDGPRHQGPQSSPGSQHSAGVSSPRSSASDCPPIQSRNTRDSTTSHHPNLHDPQLPNLDFTSVHPEQKSFKDIKRESAFASKHPSTMTIPSREQRSQLSTTDGQDFHQHTNDNHREDNIKDNEMEEDDDILVDVENVNSPLGSGVESNVGDGDDEEESGDARSTCSSTRDLHGPSDCSDKKGSILPFYLDKFYKKINFGSSKKTCKLDNSFTTISHDRICFCNVYFRILYRKSMCDMN